MNIIKYSNINSCDKKAQNDNKSGKWNGWWSWKNKTIL